MSTISRRWAAASFASTMRAPGPAASRMPARSASLSAGTIRFGDEEDLHGCGELGDHPLGARPAATRWMLSKPLRKRAVQFSQVGPAECGVSVTFGSAKSGWFLARRLLHHHVEAGARDLPLGERAVERVLVHHRARGRC